MRALLVFFRRAWFPGALVLIYLYSFPYFTEIHSANELPRIYLSMAIVDRGALDIERELRRFFDTPDTSTFKGKRYSNKAPGMSFLTTPVYLVQKLANGWKTPELPRLFFWFRLFGATIPSLLFLVLLSRFLAALVPEEGMRRLVLVAYAVGTMALTYGTLLIAHQLSGLLLATGFILIFFWARGQGRGTTPLWAGLAAGAGVLVDYQVAFIGPPLFGYLVWAARTRGRSADTAMPRGGPRRPLHPALLFCAGASLPLAALLLYHWGCFESPFKTGYNFPTDPVFRQWHSQGFLGLSAFRPAALWGRYFSADDGLFWYSPFLLLAAPGLVLMFRRRELRAEAIFCLFVILFFVYFSSSIAFVSGWDVGPRYITGALPYYLVAVAVAVSSLGRRAWGRILAYGLMVVSILIYATVNAVFPHYPDNFSNPWFDVTLRFGLAGYLPYNLGWLLGLRGLSTVLPYLAVVGALILVLTFSGRQRGARRIALGVGALAVALLVLVSYRAQLGYRRLPVPVGFLPWMERIWEPRHRGMDLKRLMPAGDPRTSGLKTIRP